MNNRKIHQRPSKRIMSLGFDIGTSDNYDEKITSIKKIPKPNFNKEPCSNCLNGARQAEKLVYKKNLIYECSLSPVIRFQKNRANSNFIIFKNKKIINRKKFGKQGFYMIYKNKNSNLKKKRQLKYYIDKQKNPTSKRSQSLFNVKSDNKPIRNTFNKVRSRSLYASNNKNVLNRLSKSPLKSICQRYKNLNKIKTLIRSCSCNRKNNNLSVDYIDTHRNVNEANCIKKINERVISSMKFKSSIKKDEKDENFILKNNKMPGFKRLDFIETISSSEKTFKLKGGVTNELTNVSSDVFLQKTLVSNKENQQTNKENLVNNHDYQNSCNTSSYLGYRNRIDFIKSKSIFSIIDTTKHENSSSWSSYEQSLISREINQPIQSSRNISKERTLDSFTSNFGNKSVKIMMIPRQSRLELFNRSSENKCSFFQKNLDKCSGKFQIIYQGL